LKYLPGKRNQQLTLLAADQTLKERILTIKRHVTPEHLFRRLLTDSSDTTLMELVLSNQQFLPSEFRRAPYEKVKGNRRDHFFAIVSS